MPSFIHSYIVHIWHVESTHVACTHVVMWHTGMCTRVSHVACMCTVTCVYGHMMPAQGPPNGIVHASSPNISHAFNSRQKSSNGYSKAYRVL